MESHHHLSTAVTDRSVFRTFALFSYRPSSPWILYILDPIKPLLILRDSTRLCAVFVKQRKNIYGVPLWQSNGKLIEEEEKNRRGGRKEQVTVTEEGEKEGKRRRKKWFLSSRRIVCSVFLVDGIARIGSWFVMGVGNSLSDVVTTSSPAER